MPRRGEQTDRQTDLFCRIAADVCDLAVVVPHFTGLLAVRVPHHYQPPAGSDRLTRRMVWVKALQQATPVHELTIKGIRVLCVAAK
jgi:hypothetical protein